MKLEEIELKNVLIHKHFKCDFCPNINVIIGANDRGKTTIFRSIKVLAENRPSNPEKKYLTRGANSKDQLIRLITTDNEIVRKDKKMYLYDKNHNLLFETKGALGTSVPEPINQALNLKPVNWQFSRASEFLLLDNGGTVAKHFEKVTGSDDFELLMNVFKEEISKSKSNLKILEKKKEELTSEYKNLDSIDLEYIKKLTRHNMMLTRTIDQNEEYILSINSKISILEKCKNKLSLNDFLKLQEKYNKLLVLLNKINNNEDIIDSLNSKISILQKEIKDINIIEKMIIKLKNIESIYSKIISNEGILNNIEIYIERLQGVHWTLKSKIEISKLEKQIKEKMKGIKICPFCDQKIV